MVLIGFGGSEAKVSFHIANRPGLKQYQALDRLAEIQPGEIQFIGEQTGNHWRKIFNCLAKLYFSLDSLGFADWQSLREQALLQKNCDHRLLFSAPDLSDPGIKIICGKTYFRQLDMACPVDWLDDYFAVNKAKRVIVCPYPDYRQLSNARIEQLACLIKELSTDL